MSSDGADVGETVVSGVPSFTLRLPNGRVEDGPVVDLRGDASEIPTGSQLRRAVRVGCPTRPTSPTVYSVRPGRAHAHVASLGPDTAIRSRAALAAVAVDIGIETPHDDDLVDALRSLRALSPAPIDDAELRAARRRAAVAGAETDRLRERVATVRGRVTALREAAADDVAADDAATAPSPDEALTEAEAALSDLTRQLSEVATERVAAAQRLRLLERRTRSARDQRNARIRLEDRVENCRRRVRAAHIDAVSDAFRDARAELDRWIVGDVVPEADTSELLDALAVARLAPIRAPLLVVGDVADALGGPDAAFDRLGAPLILR
ncbi:hypothetical protein [Halobellus salinisoli]|uniref:DUF7856 family protein n=1 Tax=Halobellus salinisoli TaxID=3108500 RepID=UPI00300B4B38